MDTQLDFLWSIVNRISEKFQDKKEEHRQIFVKKIYEDTKQVYSDFQKTLQYAYSAIEAGTMTIDEAVKFFDEKRLPFRASRMEIRGYMKHPYYHNNQELEWFNIGVMGVLCGGLHDSTERFLNYRIRENDIRAEIVAEFKGYHTLVDIIYLYDRNNMESLFYSDFFKHYLGKKELEEAIKERLLSDIRKQMHKIDQSWQLVCDNYPKIMF